MFWLARDRRNKLLLFGPGSIPIFIEGFCVEGFCDDYAERYGVVTEDQISGINIEPETVIPVMLSITPANPEQA